MTQVEFLQTENAKLRALNAHLVGRIAAAAEVLGQVAGRLPLCRCQIEAAQREASATSVGDLLARQEPVPQIVLDAMQASIDAHAEDAT